MIKRFEDYSFEENKENKPVTEDATNSDVNKTKEILNNIRNIMMLKPDMNFVTILYNAGYNGDPKDRDTDMDILSKLQRYELFLKNNQA